MLFAQKPYSIDSSFRCVISSNLNYYYGAISDCIIEDDGKIVACGNFVDAVFTTVNPFHLVRLNPDGLLDTTFHYQNPLHDEVQILNSGITRMAKFNNKYYLCYRYYIGVARFFEDGSRDTTFNFDQTPYKVGLFLVSNIFVDSIGRVILCGDMNRKNGEEDRIIRLNPDGSFDSAFHKTTCSYSMYNLIHLSSGKFLVGGWDSDPTIIRSALWRIFPDGEIDTTFDTHCTWGAANDFIELPDHKVLATGRFKFPNISDTLCLCRFHENGELDTTFKSVNYHEQIFTVGVNYNKILICGFFNTWHPYYSIKYNRFAVLNLDGTIDTTLIDRDFGPDSSAHYYPPCINFFKPAPGGKLYVGGYFSSFAGYNSFDILRLYDISVGTEEVSNKTDKLLVYPNPASETVSIHFEKSCDGFLELRDILGRLVKKCTVSRSSDDYQFNVRSYPPGLYFIRFSNICGKQIYCQKLIISKM